MRILITNDDGIRAPGLHTLVAVAKQFGEVKIVAPDRERSACAHAMTMRDPLRVQKFEWDGCEAMEVNGFPVDLRERGPHRRISRRMRPCLERHQQRSQTWVLT